MHFAKFVFHIIKTNVIFIVAILEYINIVKLDRVSDKIYLLMDFGHLV